jgi:CBS domain-containing protein
MTTAREIMTGSAECARFGESITDVARKMRDLGVGALPICGSDDRLHGMVTDRDIVVRCVAEGRDPGSIDVAKNLSDDQIGDLVEAISAAPANN